MSKMFIELYQRMHKMPLFHNAYKGKAIHSHTTLWKVQKDTESLTISKQKLSACIIGLSPKDNLKKVKQRVHAKGCLN